MTQAEFHPLPLLLRHAQVQAALELDWWNISQLRKDGDLRTFTPDPASAFAYYFKADVARIYGHGLAAVVEWAALPEWLRSGEFRAVTGLARCALDRACASGMLAAVRRRDDGNRRFYRDDLGWFL